MLPFDLPELIYNGKPALAPQYDDLERLYNLIIKHRATTVLEFGCGYSTIVISKALLENWRWWSLLKEKPEVRNYYMFECFSVDTVKPWIEGLVELNMKNVNFTHSYCSIKEWNGILAHKYALIPSDILPDFIYIDGPDPLQVWDINMPMSSDLLYLESILIPGTVVVIDGRVNNARFLQRNLQRNWKVRMEDDVTIMELDEPRLGKINAVGRDILEAVGH